MILVFGIAAEARLFAQGIIDRGLQKRLLFWNQY